MKSQILQGMLESQNPRTHFLVPCWFTRDDGWSVFVWQTDTRSLPQLGAERLQYDRGDM
jgi:hypothetical protein